MRSTRFRSSSTALLFAAAAILAGCGGGDDSGPASGSQTAPPPSGGNSAPTISGQPISQVLAEESYSFQPSASDADRDTLSFTVANLPRWATFDAASGRLSGTPSSADLGTYSGVSISVSDGRASASLAPFSIEVVETGSGVATLSWTPPTQNSDGSTLTDLSGYQISYGRSEGNLSRSVLVTNPSLSTYVVENLPRGTWFFAVSGVNARGYAGALSAVVSKTID